MFICAAFVRMQKCSLLEVNLKNIGVARGAKGAIPPSKFSENTVILCFERRFSKQNRVIRLKSSTHFGPPKFLGWLRHCRAQMPSLAHRSKVALQRKMIE